MTLSRYLTIGSTVAIARITIAQLGAVYPQTMRAPATVFSWLILAFIGFVAFLESINIWRNAQQRLSTSDFIGIAGLVGGAIALNLLLQGLGVWLAG